MRIVAVVARGDLFGIVRYVHVRIHLLAMVRDVGCCALRKFLKGTMAAEAGFSSLAFQAQAGQRSPLPQTIVARLKKVHEWMSAWRRSRKGGGHEYEHGQATE